MRRSRLKNIINKSKEMNQPVGSAFDKFSKAREESGKTYGTFSRGSYNEA